MWLVVLLKPELVEAGAICLAHSIWWCWLSVLEQAGESAPPPLFLPNAPPSSLEKWLI